MFTAGRQRRSDIRRLREGQRRGRNPHGSGRSGASAIGSSHAWSQAYFETDERVNSNSKTPHGVDGPA